MKIGRISCLLFALYAVIWQLSGSALIDVKIPSGTLILPKRDKKRLEYLFRELIIYDCAGYTLLGNKPVSFDCILKPTFKWDFIFLWHAFSPSNLKKYFALKTWQKYEAIFCNSQFLIWSESSPWNGQVELIMFANKKELGRIVQENEEDFRFCPLTELKAKPLFKEILRSHDGLIGTVLGYGRHNAWLFFENNRVHFQGLFAEEIDNLFKNKRAALNFSFGWPEVPLSEILIYPMFLADPGSEESRQLKKEYLEVRTKILNHYKGRDFLEATLELLQVS